ncbi:MAG: type II CAAX endopeptidase family protein [Pyrinomonadaceae bacterium]
MQTDEKDEFYAQLPYPAEPEAEAVPAVPTPNDPPWGSGEAFGAWFVSVLLILFVPSIFLLPYLYLSGAPMSDGAEIAKFATSDTGAILIQMLAILPAHLLTLAVAWLIVTRRKFDFRKMVGWETGGFRWWHHLIILGLFFAVAAVIGSFFPEQDNELLRILRSSRAAVFAVAFVATFTAPVVEEVIYRGVLYSAFQRTFGTAAGFVLVTLLFALVHVPQYWPSYSTIFLLTLLSVVLTSIRLFSKNLWPCIVLHTIFNGLQSFFLIIEPYVPKNASPEAALFIGALLK